MNGEITWHRKPLVFFLSLYDLGRLLVNKVCFKIVDKIKIGMFLKLFVFFGLLGRGFLIFDGFFE